MRTIFCSVSLVSLLGVGSTALAQERLETVTVTSTSLHGGDSGGVGHVTSLDRGAIIEDLGANLGDSLARQTGVTATQFGQGASRPVLRGLGAERVLVLTNGLGVLDASAASPDHQVSADALDSQRIEILRGPEALAYGGQAVGGVVNVIDGLISSVREAAPLTGEALYAVDSVNEGQTGAGRAVYQAGPWRAAISLSGRDLGDYQIPGYAESAGLRALEAAEAAAHDDHDHDHDEEHEDHASDLVENSFAKTATIGGGLTWSQDGRFIGVSLRQQTADYGIIGHSHEEGDDHEEDDHDDHDEDEGDHAEGAHEEEAPFIELEQNKFELRAGQVFDRDTGLTQIDFALTSADYEHTEFEAPGEIGSIYEVSGVEARANAHFQMDTAKYIIGANYVDASLSTAGEEAFVPSIDSNTIGVFGLRHWEGSNGLDVDGGARFESVKRDAETGSSAEFSALSGAVVASKSVSDTTRLGVQLAYTQRAPNENELFANGAHLATQQFEIGDSSLDIESNISVELSARKTLANGNIGGNIYYNDFSDFIYLQPTLSPVVTVPADNDLPVLAYTQDDARFTGGEIFGDYTWDGAVLGGDLTADFGLDFVIAQFDDGANVPLIPPARLNIGAKAAWDFGHIATDVVFADAQTNFGVGQLKAQGYTDLGLSGALSLGYWFDTLENIDVFARASNLLDAEIRAATSVTKDLAPQPGQNFRIGIKASF